MYLNQGQVVRVIRLVVAEAQVARRLEGLDEDCRLVD